MEAFFSSIYGSKTFQVRIVCTEPWNMRRSREESVSTRSSQACTDHTPRADRTDYTGCLVSAFRTYICPKSSRVRPAQRWRCTLQDVRNQTRHAVSCPNKKGGYLRHTISSHLNVLHWLKNNSTNSKDCSRQIRRRARRPPPPQPLLAATKHATSYVATTIMGHS